MFIPPKYELTPEISRLLSSIEASKEVIGSITRNQVMEKRKTDFLNYLLPRRAEIYNIIKDHRLVNFDILRRRFLNVNERTLRYDLKKLADANLIRKRGTTKGAYYEIVI